MVGCGLIPKERSLWNGNHLVLFTLQYLRFRLMSLGEAQCWVQLLLGTMNSLGRWRMLLKHFRRPCFRLTIEQSLLLSYWLVFLLTRTLFVSGFFCCDEVTKGVSSSICS
ncbi:hypothetical protein Bca52824_087815 [Brassica carinata]|uniref:Uncharacterized protein n=1 Tax=Brassica carinata TaxID=52824 RepID=A0A8X7PCJ7_BRACI|nr:hypothetical protein Bca52824_087815 [Brassica carinata]